MSQQPRGEKEEREKKKESERWREEGAHQGGDLFPRTLLPSTPRRDTRVGLTDLPRNANRYTHYTRRTITRCDTSTDALLGNVHTSEYPLAPFVYRERREVGGRAKLSIRDECMNNAEICAPCIKLLLHGRNPAGGIVNFGDDALWNK